MKNGLFNEKQIDSFIKDGIFTEEQKKESELIIDMLEGLNEETNELDKRNSDIGE